jgi:hypothetical protein
MTDMPSVYEFSEDIGNAEAPSPLPVGDYRASVRHVEAGISKSSGKKMMVVTYIVSADQFPADFTEGNPDGESFKVYQSLEDTPRNRFMLRKFCEMHGVAPSKRINLPDFMGTEVILNVSHEEYQGMPVGRANPVRAV